VVSSNLWAVNNASGTQFNMTISGYHPLVYIAVTTFADANNMGVTNLTTGLVLTQRFKTNSYNNQLNSFSGFCDTNPANGVNTYIVTNSPGSLSEFAGIALLITNGINVFGATNIVRNTSNKTGITNTVTSVSNNLVLHFVGHNTTGSGSFDGTQTLIGNANDGAGDASVKASWTNATATSTRVRLTGATSSQFEGVADNIAPQ
jgi:hypothetical protein